MLLPQAFPDEILYSRFIRYSLTSGEITTQLLKRLFGKNKVVLHPYLTAYVNNLAKLFNEDTNNLIEKQTLFPIFSFYLSHYSDSIRLAQCGNNGALVLRRCQLPSFKNKVPLVIKSCPICIKHDIYKYGVAYWHRTHQIPGITACVKHCVRLNQVDMSVASRLHYDLLPQLTNNKVIVASRKELILSDFATGLLSLLDNNTNTSISLIQVYRDQLDKRGFVTKRGRIRRTKLITCFINFWLELTRESRLIFPVSFKDYNFFRGLLDDNAPQHPFKHFLFSSWLFDTPNELFKEPEKERLIVCKQLNYPEAKNIKMQSLCLLKNGHSLAEVSRLTGKSRCYLKRIAELDDIALNLKPKILTAQIKKKIFRFAELGFHRKIIADKFKVSTGSIEQIISSYPGLVQRRKRIHFESKRRRSKVKILRYLRTKPQAYRKDVKKSCNAEFFWLYNNDNRWLEENLPAAMKVEQHSGIDWQKRDIELSERVKELLLPLDDRHISRTDLDKWLGGHGWLTKYKAKLPLTMAVYNDLNVLTQT